jgi:membrane fusion protein (multidrug efflux system)
VRAFVRTHRRSSAIGAGISLILAIVAAIYLWRWLESHETTDDAQVDGHIAAISARVHGKVTDVRVQENDAVHRGDLLVQLDPRDYQVALARAHSELAHAVAERVKTAHDAERMRFLRKQQAAAPQDYDARIASAREAVASVEVARANLERAKLDLEYTQIIAPFDGVIGKRIAEAGQDVSVGQELLSLVDLRDLWITANFKETQLHQLRPGLRARVHVDALDRNYDATVESFGAASGARFSILPPENATGNYVKVVQRIPLRLRLEARQPELARLRPGMSVEVKVYLK